MMLSISSLLPLILSFLNPQSTPVVGKESTRAALEGKIGMLTWQTAKADVSRSGDLGYTYGAYELEAGADAKLTESGNYMRIWRKQKDGKWRVALDLLNLILSGTFPAACCGRDSLSC